MGPLKGLVGILLIANVFGTEIIQNERALEAFSDDSHEAVSPNQRDEKCKFERKSEKIGNN